MNNIVFAVIIAAILGAAYGLILTKNNRIKIEKLKMNKIRFTINYYVAMPFLAFGIFGALVSCRLMDIDEVKYLPILITYFIIIGVFILGFFIAMPIIRKHEIKIESEKIDYNLDDIKDKSEFIFLSNKGFNVIFSQAGIKIDEQLYSFSQFNVSLQTSNKYMIVNLNLCFDNKDENSNEKINSFFISLTKESLYAIQKYNIPIQYQEDLDYIINNKENAVKQILTYGMLKHK
ncbi:MAG: hypothetical protein GYA50_02020 [Eubacteriaceae bacterium]|nr:hypothetical protein [Eubacteriaceae bacterium]